MAEIKLPLLASVILYARTHNLPLELCYHPDADPGDGSGWAVLLGDRWGHGALEAALERVMEGRDAP